MRQRCTGELLCGLSVFRGSLGANLQRRPMYVDSSDENRFLYPVAYSERIVFLLDFLFCVQKVWRCIRKTSMATGKLLQCARNLNRFVRLCYAHVFSVKKFGFIHFTVWMFARCNIAVYSNYKTYIKQIQNIFVYYESYNLHNHIECKSVNANFGKIRKVAFVQLANERLISHIGNWNHNSPIAGNCDSC